jgi:DNA invertase Pin-like site-specific DNA recombinase
MNNLIGYARVSKGEQNLDSQVDALLHYGCLKKNIFVDKISGSKGERPGLIKCLETIEPGDTLVIWRFDRLGRSLKHLIETVETLQEKEIGFKSICDGHIDTTTASGELIFNIFSSLAQFERKLIQERTKAGLKAARARGRLGGRPPLSPNNPKVIAAQQMHKNLKLSIGEICKELDISVTTLYRYLNAKPKESAK